MDYETPAGTFLCNYGQETSGVPNTAQAILTVNAVTWAGKFFKSMTYMTISTNKVFMKTFSSDKLYGDWIEIK